MTQTLCKAKNSIHFFPGLQYQLGLPLKEKSEVTVSFKQRSQDSCLVAVMPTATYRLKSLSIYLSSEPYSPYRKTSGV